MGFGGALIFDADFGIGAIGTFVDGMHYLLNITRGTANILACFALMIPAYIFTRRFIGIGTYISLFGVGLAMDFWKWLIDLLPFESLLYRIIVFVFGMIISSLGAGIYIVIGRGISSFDALPMIACKYLPLQYKHARILVDCLLLLFGFLMGGTIGIGTLVGALTGGYITQFTIIHSAKRLKRSIPINEESPPMPKVN